MIITRKIEIYVLHPDKTVRDEYQHKLHEWRLICHKAANLASSHLYVQDNIKDLIYLTENVKVKLADKLKDEAGILNTSYQNSIYRLLSENFLGKIPSSILTNLAQNIVRNYKNEKPLMYAGKKSLRSYRSTIPIPIGASSIVIAENEQYFDITLQNIPMRAKLGADRSNNRSIILNVINKTYKLSTSSIQWDATKKKFFLLLCVDIPNTRFVPNPGTNVNASLGFHTPIEAICGKRTEKIGNEEEYLHNRLQIQSRLRNLQADLRYSTGGRGRGDKLSAINRFKQKEANYITTKLHTYSRLLVNFAIAMRAESITLKKLDETGDEKYLLRNWSYSNLLSMIQYKCNQVNIALVIEQ